MTFSALAICPSVACEQLPARHAAGPPTGLSATDAAALCADALTKARGEFKVPAIATAFGAVERELLLQAQAAASGNITQMAELLGWSRITVREKLKLHRGG